MFVHCVVYCPEDMNLTFDSDNTIHKVVFLVLAMPIYFVLISKV